MDNLVLEQVKQLPRKVLRHIETEFGLYKTNHPGETIEINNMFKRLRKSILDEIGDVTRIIEGR